MIDTKFSVGPTVKEPGPVYSDRFTLRPKKWSEGSRGTTMSLLLRKTIPKLPCPGKVALPSGFARSSSIFEKSGVGHKTKCVCLGEPVPKHILLFIFGPVYRKWPKFRQFACSSSIFEKSGVCHKTKCVFLREPVRRLT